MSARRFLVVTALVITAAATTVAAAGRPLPAFPLTAMDGTVVQSTDVMPEGHALLLFVQAGCRPCDNLLSSIKTEKMPAIPARLIVVVGGASLDDVAAMKARYPDLQESVWLADTPWAGWSRLGLSGLPIVEGMRDNSLEWRLSGAQPPDKIASVLGTWVAMKTRPQE